MYAREKSPEENIEKRALRVVRGTLRSLLPEYTGYLEGAGYARTTVAARERGLGRFVDWCEERSVTRAADVTAALVERYMEYLSRVPSRGKRTLLASTRAGALSELRSFFAWTTRRGLTLFNVALEQPSPDRGRKLPRGVLTAAEVERIMNVPDIGTLQGVRDRALLEVLYSTAMRRAEACALLVDDVDMSRGLVFVRQGKGGRERLVPVGERALKWLNLYLRDARPSIMAEPNERRVFLTLRGKPLTPNAAGARVSKCKQEAGIEKEGAAHSLRHAAATLMLENGADIRFVQQLLGHESLRSTQIYTHVAVGKLQEVHRLTHPAGRKPDLNSSL